MPSRGSAALRRLAALGPNTAPELKLIWFKKLLRLSEASRIRRDMDSERQKKHLKNNLSREAAAPTNLQQYELAEYVSDRVDLWLRNLVRNCVTRLLNLSRIKIGGNWRDSHKRFFRVRLN